jgi:hypothetical protein
MKLVFAARWRVVLAVLAGIGLFAAANAQLFHAAFTSEQACVAHLKAPGGPGQFRAAQSSC